MSFLVNTPQRTILFLIADTGAGHRSAANAISNAVKIISQKEQEEWKTCRAQRQAVEDGTLTTANDEEAGIPPPLYRIEIVDVFEEYSRFPLREAMKLYGPTIRYNPKLFGEFFHMSNREGPVLAVKALATPLILNGLLRLFTSVQPDIIVSIHPMLNHVTVHALRELGLRIPFLTVVTDLVSIHYAWYAPGVDGYIVPTEQARQLYIKRGLDADRVHMLGMPIDPKFTRPLESKAELQRKFGLKPGIPAILLVGGGDGAGGLQTAVRAISHARLPVQLLVVTGRNRRLYAHLQRTRSKLRVPAKIFGFVQNMPELMHAADIIVTKAGPGTICEALSCDLPIILSGYVPGQEEGNVEYVVSNDVGVLALHPTTLIDTLRKLIKPGSQDLKRRLHNARRISRPAASFDIAHCILSYLPPRTQPSVWQSPLWEIRQRKMSSRLLSARRIHHLSNRLPRPLLKNPMVRRLTSARTRDISQNTEQPIDQGHQIQGSEVLLSSIGDEGAKGTKKGMAKFYYGGQAVIEGVMMRGRTSVAMAIRRMDGSIYLHEEALNPRLYQNKLFRLPFLRGMLLLWEMLVLGTRLMTVSANISSGALQPDAQKVPSLPEDDGLFAARESQGVSTELEAPPQIGGVTLVITLLISLSFAVAIFFVGPLLLTHLLRNQIGEGWLNLTLEGVIRLALLVGYLYLIGRVPDIQRVFGYHGAEHKAINAMEQGDPLDVAHVRRASRVHTRCGTGFLLLVMVVSIFVFALVGSPALIVKVLSRILLVPVVAGVAYELMRLGAANYRYRVVRWLLAPGLALQGLTTREPDDSMLECAIAALKRAMLRDKLAGSDVAVGAGTFSDVQ